jgi:hypothetical protein
VLGFLAGAYMALWFDSIVFYLTTSTTTLPDNSDILLILLIVIIGGLIGMFLTRQFPNEALILIAMLVGVDTISQALKLDPTSIWTAIIILSLALVGVIVQYADYLRQLKANTPLTAPQPVMMEPPISEKYL